MYLRKNITNNIDKINYFLGRKIFNNFNSFTFNLFKYVYKKISVIVLIYKMILFQNTTILDFLN